MSTAQAKFNIIWARCDQSIATACAEEEININILHIGHLEKRYGRKRKGTGLVIKSFKVSQT